MEPIVPDTNVLAIVVYGHVGNTMASIVMQSLGCDVSVLNTVQFSNHTGYGRFRGTKASAQEISDIYAGLKENNLTDFDILLSGYAPSAEAVSAVGAIARDLKLQTSTKPGTFFWILDPVMGDEGKLYVSEGCVPVYKELLRDADLILPNQFELELLSGVQITSTQAIKDAIETLHREYQVPHVIVTSIHETAFPGSISVIGSTARSDMSARIFKISVPSIDCYFSGTGDMFAGLMVVRLREAITKCELLDHKSWVSPDEVVATSLPLAQATEKVLESMQAVLAKTKRARDDELQRLEAMAGLPDYEPGNEEKLRLKTSKAAEVRIVRCLEDLKRPTRQFKAVGLQAEEDEQNPSLIAHGEQISTVSKTIL